MALKAFVLPVCDVCGQAWLPEPGPAREDPRKYDREQRAAALPPLRCGKCKATGWDRNYTGDRRRKNPHELTEGKHAAPTRTAKKLHVEHKPRTKGVSHKTAPRVERCRKHLLVHCPQCHPSRRG